jgi:hypothetical protein
VSAGAMVMVEGNTNAQGFVEADRIEILEAGITLPPMEPTETEGAEDATQKESPVIEDSDQDKTGKETLSSDDKIDASSEKGDDQSSSKDSGGGEHSEDGSSSSSGESGDD